MNFKLIPLKTFLSIIKNNNSKKDIKLKIEGKVLKGESKHIIIKKLVVSDEFFKDLGMKGPEILDDEDMIDKPPKPPTLRELMQEGFSRIDKELDSLKNREKNRWNVLNEIKNDVKTLKNDMEMIKSLPTIKKEIQAQKELNTLKQN